MKALKVLGVAIVVALAIILGLPALLAAFGVLVGTILAAWPIVLILLVFMVPLVLVAMFVISKLK